MPPPPAATARREDDFGDTSDSDEDDTSGMRLPWVTSPAMRPRAGSGAPSDAVSGSESSDDERAGTSPQRTTTHYGRTIPAWSPGIRGRAARTREVLAVARNAREQAKENEFLRLRVRELERELGTHHETVKAAQTEARKSQTETKQREVHLLAECAAHEASAAQLEEELERMRAIEEQSAVEAMHLVQKMSRLQTELAGATRRANIAEEMLMGFQSEGERAAADAERWRFEAERVEAEQAKQTELEERHAKAMRELAELRDENALMRADINALHSGMEAQLRAEATDRDGEDVHSSEEEDKEADDAFGTPLAAAPETPEGSPARKPAGEEAAGGEEAARPAEGGSPGKTRGGSKSETPSLDQAPTVGPTGGPTGGPGPSKGDGVIYLRGRAVRVEGATPGGARERPPPPHRSGWASPARSSFAKKMLAQFEKAEGGDTRTPFRSLSQPHMFLANADER